MKRILMNILEAEQIIKRVNHMVYVTYPLIQDKKIALKIIFDTKNAIVKCMNAILLYETKKGTIKLSKNSEENLRIFKIKCASKYNLNLEEMREITKLLELVKKCKESPFEFKRQEKIVVLSKNSVPEIILVQNIRDFLTLAKNILENCKMEIITLKGEKYKNSI